MQQFETRMISHIHSLCLIASDCLPVTAAMHDGKLVLQRSAGGLATSLASVHGSEGSRWIGWPGGTGQFDRKMRSELDAQLLASGMFPVHPTTRQVERFCEGFCNGVLWPLFHCLLDKVRLDAWRGWAACREANERFAECVANHCQPVGVVCGSKVVEFRQFGIHKGLLVSALHAAAPQGALLVAIGDDTTDEDMFKHLPPDGIGIHVGSLTSRARFRLGGHHAVRTLLQEISQD